MTHAKQVEALKDEILIKLMAQLREAIECGNITAEGATYTEMGVNFRKRMQIDIDIMKGV